MTWWNPRTWGERAAAELPLGGAFGAPGIAVASGAEPSAGPSPDLSEFMRSTWSLDQLGLTDVLALGAIGAGCTPTTRAEWVPLEVLDAIGTDPIVYAMERVLLSPAQDPELYYLRGEPTVVAEVEAWLRPLLTSQRASLLAQVTRAFSIGAVPIVLDYEAGPGGVRYVRSHEVWPGEAQLRVDGDRLLAVVYDGVEYGGEDLEDPGRARAFLSLWDPAYGRWTGQGCRRRAYRDWLEGAILRLWELRALERSVDPLRIGYAPEGDLQIGVTKTSGVKLMRAQMASVRNGSVMTLPSTLDANGNALWRVEAPFPAGAGHEIAKQAIDARDLRKAWACLSPGGPVDKATEEQFMDSVQSVCDFAAAFLTRVVRVGLRVRYGSAAPVLQVLANDIPKRKLRTVTTVFAAVADATQRLPDGRVYTLGELVDPEILDQLGIKARSVEEAAHEPAAFGGPPGKPGRPLDPAGRREERRDAAETVEGEGDTGGEGPDAPEREEL